MSKFASKAVCAFLTIVSLSSAAGASNFELRLRRKIEADLLRVFPKRADFRECQDLRGPQSEIRAHIQWDRLGDTTSTVRFRCNSGAYNESFLFFFVDTVANQIAARLILFPNDPFMLMHADIKDRWKLTEYQHEVFARDFDVKNRHLVALRKGLGDGSIGYFTEYELNAKTGVPQLIISAARITEDHQAGYNYESGKTPAGEGWIVLRPKSKLIGKTVAFP